MRTHFLEKLELRGQDEVLQEIPAFDLYHLREVERFEWASGVHDQGRATLTLMVLYDNSGELLRLQLICFGVRLLRLPSLTGVFAIDELEIEDLRSDQLEGIRYRLKDYGGSNLEILCESISIEIVSAMT